MDTRRIRKVVKSHATEEGAGVHLHRAIGLGPPEEYDPFLLLDDFRSDVPSEYRAGFPWHPHRGMETITYVLRGEVEHQDSLGNKGVIAAGDLQWMSAGSGIIHQEMPKGDAKGAMYGFQLWANLPASLKMSEPRYQGIEAAEIPEVTDAGGATVRVVAGEVNGVVGPVRDVATRPEYLDVTIPAGKTFTHPTPRGHTVFAYVIGGRALFNRQDDPYSYQAEGDTYFDQERDRLIGDRHLVLFGDGEEVVVTAGDDGPLRLLLVSGKPIGEPIAWRGPVVMNTQAELRVAFDELDKGTFVKHARKPR
ncbi:MAG: pirin family protein [Polyangiaceae bacterium]|jgi:redox-sensitive bicupin YhaK (pirin superfamily)